MCGTVRLQKYKTVRTRTIQSRADTSHLSPPLLTASRVDPWSQSATLLRACAYKCTWMHTTNMEAPAPAADVPQGRNVAVLHALQPVDFVAACPVEPDLLCCTTYNLNKETGTKTGSIMLVNAGTQASEVTGHPAPSVLNVIETDAIFDAKWVTTASTRGLLTATSGGAIDYWALSASDAAAYVLQKQAILTLSESAAVYVDVADSSLISADGGSTMEIMVARSDGVLSRCKFADGTLLCLQEWSAHSYGEGLPAEIWMCKWDQHDNANTVWSAGDDAMLKCWDVRTDCRKPMWVNKGHGAGVCSVAFHPTLEHLASTGSYDQFLRVWDKRSMKVPLSAVDTGGGVWRINWSKNSEGGDLLDVACMYAGAKLYAVNNSPLESVEHAPVTVRQFCEYLRHSSMVYGIERLRGQDGAHDVLVTCSFYDQQIHFWRE